MKLPQFIIAVLICFFGIVYSCTTVAASPVSTPAARDTIKSAEGAAATWFKMLDSGNYQECWSAQTKFAKSSLPEDMWVQITQSLVGLPGPLLSRTLLTAVNASTVKNSPPGQYIILTYKCLWKKAGVGSETLSMQKSPAGIWEVAAFAIKSSVPHD